MPNCHGGVQTYLFTVFEVTHWSVANATEPAPGHLLHETTFRFRSKKTGEEKTVMCSQVAVIPRGSAAGEVGLGTASGGSPCSTALPCASRESTCWSASVLTLWQSVLRLPCHSLSVFVTRPLAPRGQLGS